MDTIVVEPLKGGWSVRADTVANDMVFKSGRQAEDTARALALRLANNGRPVRLTLKIKDGQVAARFVCLPPVGPQTRSRLMELPAPLIA